MEQRGEKTPVRLYICSVGRRAFHDGRKHVLNRKEVTVKVDNCFDALPNKWVLTIA